MVHQEEGGLLHPASFQLTPLDSHVEKKVLTFIYNALYIYDCLECMEGRWNVVGTQGKNNLEYLYDVNRDEYHLVI